MKESSDVPPATPENLRGTSADRDNPVWPHWTEIPPKEFEVGKWRSDEPYWRIDGLTGTMELICPGTPMRDIRFYGQPQTYQNSGIPGGNPWMSRLNVWRGV
jgi:hypothetical protein